MKKKILVFAVAFAMVFAMAACQTAADDGKYNVGICQLMVHDSLDQATQGFIDALTAEMEAAGAADENLTSPFLLRMASIVVATVPIMCVYPFLQKYFMSGLVLGGVKE